MDAISRGHIVVAQGKPPLVQGYIEHICNMGRVALSEAHKAHIAIFLFCSSSQVARNG